MPTPDRFIAWTRGDGRGDWFVVDTRDGVPPAAADRVALCPTEGAAQAIARAMNATVNREADAGPGRDETAISPGEVVRLRSGGPLMTVGEIHADRKLPGLHLGGAVACFWHDDDMRAASGLFPPVALERASDKAPDLYKAAVALWGAEPALVCSGQNCSKTPFDYLQNPSTAARVRALGEALTAVDGIPRTVEFDEEDR